MNSIQSQSLAGGLSPRQNALSDAQFSSYLRKQSLSAYESLDAGLTIKTKEGDLVTLNSSSYAQLDSFMYDSKGILKTESGTASVTQNMREITLSSGESFSFSVAGDLNEEELEDIEAIVKGIDGIISEVAQGDMDEAVEKALSMGGYDSVSMYSADITYQKSYAMTSEMQAQTSNMASEPEALAQKESAAPFAAPLVSSRDGSPRMKNNSIQRISQLMEKMAEQLEKHEEKLVEKSRKPIDKLFRHHLRNEKDEDGRQSPHYNAIEKAQEKVSKLIDKMVGEMFKGNLSAFMKG